MILFFLERTHLERLQGSIRDDNITYIKMIKLSENLKGKNFQGDNNSLSENKVRETMSSNL